MALEKLITGCKKMIGLSALLLQCTSAVPVDRLPLPTPPPQPEATFLPSAPPLFLENVNSPPYHLFEEVPWEILCLDSDGDGYGTNCFEEDCDDSNPFIQPSETTPLVLFSSSDGVYNAKWSPDGSRVAFIAPSGWTGETFPQFTDAFLYLMRLDGSFESYELPITYSSPSYPEVFDWLGQTILYAVHGWSYDYWISLFDITNGESTLLFHDIGTSGKGALLEDGRAIFECGRYNCGFPELCLADEDGVSRIADLTTVSEPHRISGWDVSPTGNVILYALTPVGHIGMPVCEPFPFADSIEVLSEALLYQYDLTANTRSIVTTLPSLTRASGEIEPASDVELAYSSSGEYILLNLSDHSRNTSCYLFSPDTLEFTPVASGGRCFWNPDGENIFLVHGGAWEMINARSLAPSRLYHLEGGRDIQIRPTGDSFLSVDSWNTVQVTYFPCELQINPTLKLGVDDGSP